MRATTLVPGAPERAGMSEREDPRPGEGELLVEGLLVGVCGTDREIVQGGHGALPPGAPDVVIEATGAASLVFEVLARTGPNAITVLTGLSRSRRTVPLAAGAINDELVLENDVVVGSVNANLRHYRAAADALAAADPGWLAGMLTRPVPLERWTEALSREDGDVKVVVDLAAG